MAATVLRAADLTARDGPRAGGSSPGRAPSPQQTTDVIRAHGYALQGPRRRATPRAGLGAHNVPAGVFSDLADEPGHDGPSISACHYGVPTAARGLLSGAMRFRGKTRADQSPAATCWFALRSGT